MLTSRPQFCGHRIMHPLAARRPSITTRHSDVQSWLVNEFQPFDWICCDLLAVSMALQTYVRSVPFCGAYGLFFSTHPHLLQNPAHCGFTHSPPWQAGARLAVSRSDLAVSQASHALKKTSIKANNIPSQFNGSHELLPVPGVGGVAGTAGVAGVAVLGCN